MRNGLEFSSHEKINKIFNIKSYFRKPCASYEKGTVENINSLIRRFFLKRNKLRCNHRKQIRHAEDWIDNRPMKILDFGTR